MNTNELNILKETAQKALESGAQLNTPITFYSKTPCLGIGISPGQMMRDAAGFPVRVGEKIVEFNPINNGIKRADGSIQKFGYLNVTDPETALKLLNRCERPDTDIMLGDEYLKMVTPPEVQINNLQVRAISAENELERLMRENQRLEEENRRAQAALAAAETAPGRKGARAE